MLQHKIHWYCAMNKQYLKGIQIGKSIKFGVNKIYVKAMLTGDVSLLFKEQRPENNVFIVKRTRKKRGRYSISASFCVKKTIDINTSNYLTVC